MNSAKTPKLRSCYVKPKQGIAFFDDITIHADNITDIRENSVFPVMEEKQIYMCRQMKSSLMERDNPLVLDVGTGSGVYAIYAAAKCGCRVIAIDTSTRALRIAKDNAQTNHVPIVDDLEDLKPGSICFMQVRFGESFLSPMQTIFPFDIKEKFDFVILSPPNMLTSPDIPAISIAKHAHAGKDGQKPFLEQIKYVPTVLKTGGSCLGIQMTPVNEKGIPKAVKDIDRAFNDRCQITITKIFNEDLLTRDLLEGQYKTFLDYLKDDQELVKQINGYIDEITDLYPKLTQIFYKIVKEDSANIARHHFIPFNPENPGHTRDWKDRIWVYRNIVDYSSRRGYFPTPSIFTSDFAGNLISAKNAHERRKDKKPQSPLDLIDSRIKRHAMQKDNDFLFDTILIEVVPVFATKDIDAVKHNGIRQTCKVWASARSKKRDIRLSAENTLLTWQRHTKFQQKARLGTFFHPGFIGTISPDQWGQAFNSTLSTDIDISFDQDYYNALSKYYSRIEKYCEKDSDKQDIYAENETSSNIRVPTDSIFTLEDSVDLNQLGVPDFKEYCEDLTDLESESIRIPSLKEEKYSCLVQQTRDDRKGVIDFLMGSNSLEKNSQLWNEVLEKDAEFCHKAWHMYFTDQLKRVSKGDANLSQHGFSSLISLPIFIQNVSGKLNDLKEPLEDYRGGIWIYASSSDAWTLEHEKYLQVLARLTLLLCIEQYALIAPDISEDEGEEYRSKLLGHEVKHVASAMSNNWVRPITDFFEIGEYADPKPSSNKIGRIEIWDERFLKDLWKKNLAITPFRDLIGSAGQLINFWCLLHNPADVPFSEESPPEDLETFIKECWDWAVDTVIMHALSRENPSTPDRVLELQRIRGTIKKIYDLPILELEKADFPRIAWDVKVDSSSKTVWLCRLMVALFTNCVKHSDPTQKIKISLGCMSKKNNLYWIEIDDYKSLGDETNQSIREQIFVQDTRYEEIVEEACEYLEKAKYKLEYLDSKLNLSTKEVVDTCLRNLMLENPSDGVFPKFSWPNKVRPGEHFFVKIPFNYPEG